MRELAKIVILVICAAMPALGLAQMVINEIHADPDPGLAGDANGDGVRDATEDEFVELMNTSGSDIDISGWTLSDAASVRHTFPDSTIVPANCAIVVFGGGSPVGAFGGALVQTAFLGLNNSGDTITLNDGTADVATYTYGSTPGESLTRDPDGTGDPLVQHSIATGAGGAFFSPGTKIDGSAFSGCSSPGTGSITVIKETDPAGGTGFSFTGDLGAFDLDDGQSMVFDNLAAGDYDVTESLPLGWQLDNVSVTGASSTVITDGVTIHLAAGETATATFTNTPQSLPGTSVIINEIDSDTPGTDSLEFVELFDGGSGNTSLDSMVLVFFNGSSDQAYDAFDLDGHATNSDGYFVLGNALVPNIDEVFANGSLQNGADAVALYFGDAADFPNGTPISTATLIDAVVYDTNDPDDAGLAPLLNAGQPQVNEAGADNKDEHSLQRIPNGAGGARNTNTYIPIPPTPGAENLEPPPSADLSVTKSDDSDPATIGDNVTYTISVTNNGPDEAEKVILTDTLPTDVTFVSVTAEQGTCDESGGVITCALGNLPDGSTIAVEVVLTVEIEGTITNEVTVTANTPDPDAQNNVASESTTVAPLPTTSVVINEVDSDTPGIDDLEFIELFDGGAGNTSLNGLVIVLFNGADDKSYKAFDLDGETTGGDGFFVIGSASVPNVDLVIPNATLQNGPDAVALYFGNASAFPNDTPVTTNKLIDAVVYDTDDPDAPGLLTLLLSGPQVNENGAGDKDNHSIQRIPNGAGGVRNTSAYLPIPPTPGVENFEPLPQADLSVTKTDDRDPATIGDNVTYTISVTNNGPDEAHNVILIDTLPDGVTFVSATPDHGACDESGGVITCAIDNLPDASTIAVEVVVTVETVATITNGASVTASTDDPDSQNNSTIESTTVEPVPSTSVVINEIDSDTPGTDDLEFIELFDGGAGNTSLDGLVVVLFNGGDDKSYKSFDLDGKSTGGDGFFVLGSAGVPNVDLVIPNATLQNGPDAVALYFGNASAFPNDTPVTTNKLIDAVVYDTDDPDDAGLLILLLFGPQVNENGAGDKDNHSIQRIPNGAGGVRNTGTYIPIPPTPGAVNLAPPDIATAETALDFGDVAVGKELDLDLILKNKGAEDLVVDSTVVVGDDAGEWQITTGVAPFMIAPGRDHKVRVCFSPTSMGEKQAALRIRSNDPDGDPLEIPLTGVGLAPKISASTDKVLFGRVDVASAKEMTFDLFNTGTAALKVTRITIGGSNGKQFEVVNQEVPFTLQPDDSKRFTVLFKPDTVGILKGIVRFVSNDPADEKFDVGLKGIGRQPDAQPDIAITPDSLAFGLVQTGTFASKIVTLSNEGEALLQVAGVEITGADADQWQIASGGAPFSLAAGETHEIGLHFAPTSEGLKSAALQLASNDPDENPLLLPLSGTGVTGAGLPLAGIVVINEIHYNPATSQGSDGKFEFLELHNTSDMPIVLAGLHFSAGINHTFQPGDTLRAGGFFVLAVDSTSYPGSIEWQSGNLVNTGETVQLLDATGALVDSVSYGNSAPWPADANGGGPSLELVDPFSDNSLAGNWQASFVSGGTPGAPNSTPGEMQPDIAVSPTELDFGDVEVGRAAELVVTIANVGLLDLQVDSTVIIGANANQWQITAGQAPFVLSGGESRDVSIRFMPDSAGPKEAHLRIASSDTDEPTVTVRLAGTGVTGTASPFAGIIVINEIHYNPSTEQGSDADFEFLELINTSDADIDLQGLAFAEGVVYTFQTGEILPAAGFLVLAKNATTYPGSIQWTSGNLVNTGESIKLVDENGAEVDVVVYDNSTPWPTSANGGGPSLELVHASSDNNDPLNWQASTIPGGTPGAPNSVSSVTQPDIAVRPDSLVFGIVNLRESKTLSLRIGNAGQENLEIVSLVLSGPAADQFVMGEITVPFTLAPGEEVEFPVQSNPLATGARQAELQIASNDPDENLLVIPVTMYVNSPPEAPALVAPGWGEAADRLAWRGSDPDGDELAYFLEIAEDIQFTLNLFASGALDDTSLYLTEISTFTEGASYYWRVQARDEYEAESGHSPTGYFRFVATPTSVAAAPAALPDEFALLQNYPNPFNPETQIRFQLPEVSQVLIRIFNVTGQKIRTLVDESYPAGSYAATWNGFDDSGHPVASGIYIYQLLVTTSETRSGPAFSQVRKMSLLR